jgi:uncharacterized glyoxalase superfamily protein PhnB
VATGIAPMLAVKNGHAAIEFYVRAFGASELWRIEGGAVAGLEIDGAPFFLAQEFTPKTVAPLNAGHTTVRIELFVDDPRDVHARAIAAGAREGSPVQLHTHTTTGTRSSLRMLQGSVIDPDGHTWLIGTFLEPPS